MKKKNQEYIKSILYSIIINKAPKSYFNKEEAKTMIKHLKALVEFCTEFNLGEDLIDAAKENIEKWEKELKNWHHK